MGQVRLRHAAVVEAGDLHRDHVLGDFHLRGFPVGLRPDTWRSRQRDASVRHLRVRCRHGRWSTGDGGVDRSGDAAAAGADHLRHVGLYETHQIMMGERGGWRIRTIRLWLPLGAYMIFTLFPFYWMAVTSLKPNGELYNRKIMPLIVYHPTMKHYVDLLSETNFLLWTWNTFLVAVVSTAISLVFSVIVAYPLARMRFAGSALIAFGVAATYLVPQPLLFIPLADIITKLGLSD